MANNSVLIVEDTPVNLKVMRVLLTRQGFDVRTATTAEQALEVLKEFTPRVVLTDIQLPGMDGLELIRRLKSNPVTHDTIVLAVTAFAMKGDEMKAFDAVTLKSIQEVLERYPLDQVTTLALGPLEKIAALSN